MEIRNAFESDLPEILRMMEAFADLAGLRQYLTVSKDDLAGVIFGPQAFVRLLVAAEGPRLIGYALYYPHFASFRGEPGFFLEDIYVEAHQRGRGVGDLLLMCVAHDAAERGYRRIDFHVDRANEQAIRFYRSRGAECNESDVHFKFAGEAFERLGRSDRD